MKFREIQKYLLNTILLLACLVLLSCNGSGGGGGDGFASLSEGEISTTPAPESTPATGSDTTLSINTFTPAADPYTIGATTETFAFSVNGSGTITYDFLLNAVNVQSGSSPFYNLNGAILAPGAYTLVARATNSVNSVSHTFNVIKNTAPAIDSSTPAPGSYNLNCGVENRIFTLNTSDANSDAMTYTWLLNGNVVPTEISVVDTASTSTATFSPTCSLNGTYTVTGRVSDGTDTTETTWTVVVGNPNVATIDAISPSAGPIVVLSTNGTQNISLSASGTPPLSYAWELDSVPVGSNSSTYAFTETTPASYTVDVTVTDSTSNDTAAITVVKNGKPVLTNVIPSDSSVKMNYASTKIFSIDASDPNAHGMTYTWKLNGGTSAKLVAAPTAGGSQGTFTPDDSILGTQTISVEVNDGYETTTQAWSVTVNRFRDSCNNLTSDQICTAYGMTGLGDGSSATTGDAFAVPHGIALDGSGGYFVSDAIKSVVWYVNKTGSSQVRLGVTIPDGDTKIVVGMGAAGKSPDGLTGRSFKLYYPQGIVYHTARQELYIADYSNHRVVRVESTGVARGVLGNGGTGDSSAQHANGLGGQVHSIRNAQGIALHEASNTLYVSSYDGHYIKKFDISDATYTNWTGEVVVGKDQGGSDSITNALEDGLIGYVAGGARTQYPTSLAISSDNKYLFFYGRSFCRLRIANMDSSSVEFIGVTTNAGEVKTLTNNNCGNQHEVAATNYAPNQIYTNGLALHESGGVVKGFFVSGYYNHEIGYINSSGVSQTFGGRTIADDNAGRILGIGTAATTGDGLIGMNANIYNPRGIAADANSLYVAAYNGNRVRKLDLSTANGLVSSDALYSSPRAYIENVNPGEAYNYDLQGLKYDASTKLMYMTSYSSGRINSINTVTGQQSWVLGRGNNNTTQYSQTAPNLAYVAYPRAPTIVDGVLFFINWNNPGANRSCNISAFNNTGADVNLFNVPVNDGKLNQISGGSYADGCVTWNVADEGNPAVSTKLNSGYGLDYINNTELLYADYRDHCIKKIDAAGNISTLIGQCGSAGNTMGLYNDASIRIRYPRSLKEDPLNPGNFFFIDYTDQSTYGYLRYVNRTGSTININGTGVLGNFIQTVYTQSGGYLRDVALKDDWVCVTSGHEYVQAGAHNIQCFERTSGTLNRIGPSTSDLFKNQMAFTTEEEGIDSANARFSGPSAIEFDGDGNLWVAEYNTGRIRMIKKWW